MTDYEVFTSDKVFRTRWWIIAEAASVWLGLRSWLRLRPERVTIISYRRPAPGNEEKQG